MRSPKPSSRVTRRVEGDSHHRLVIPLGGAEITPEQAAVALREAMQIIESVGTTGIYGKEKKARDWMRKYFPAYAESGTW